MARVDIDASAIHTLDRGAGTDPATVTGDTIIAGVGDGFEIPYAPGNILVLRNETGGPGVVTFKTVNPQAAGAVSLTVADKTVSVADGEALLYPLSAIFRQSDDKVYLDCDVALDVAVLQVG